MIGRGDREPQQYFFTDILLGASLDDLHPLVKFGGDVFLIQPLFPTDGDQEMFGFLLIC